MPRYVAFLRAINVGGRTVKMAELRVLFEAMGLGRVETFIASGNVLFDAPSAGPAALERRIEEGLERALGYRVATFLRSPGEIVAAAAHQPFGSPDPLAAGEALSIAFLKTAPTPEARQAVLALGTEIDDFHVREREIYWRCRTKVSASTISGARLERTLGAPATVRNVTTVRRLALKLPAPPPGGAGRGATPAGAE
jgi:uncharacterized protein (DUF1697 family)